MAAPKNQEETLVPHHNRNNFLPLLSEELEKKTGMEKEVNRFVWFSRTFVEIEVVYVTCSVTTQSYVIKKNMEEIFFSLSLNGKQLNCSKLT